MRVYLLRGDLDYHWLQPAEPGVWHWRSGVPVSFEWRIPELELPGSTREPFVPVDCLAANTGADGPVLSEYAVGILGDVLRLAGELWPVRVLGHPYWWLNCLATVDALDQRDTEADWDDVRGDWGEFRWITLARRLAFRREALSQASAVFRVPEFPAGYLFVRESFEAAVTEHGLTGFRLDLVWSLDGGGVWDPAGVGLAGAFEERRPEELARKRAGAIATLKQRRRHASGSR